MRPPVRKYPFVSQPEKDLAVTTTESPTTQRTTTAGTGTPLPGIDLQDPARVAEGLRDEFRVSAAERDRERRFPYEQCAAFRASGLLGLMVPGEYGGYGGTFAELMRVVIAISAGDSNIGQMYQLHTGGIRLLQNRATRPTEPSDPTVRIRRATELGPSRPTRRPAVQGT